IKDVEMILEFIYNDFHKYRFEPAFKNKFPKKWQPITFMIIEEPFSEENHMINSTMKMVRYKIIESYKDKIEYMYTTEGSKYLNEVNKAAINKIFS
ncbi:MAG: hypothetical protein ACK4YF_07410, partial [Exilispira sp.]